MYKKLFALTLMLLLQNNQAVAIEVSEANAKLTKALESAYTKSEIFKSQRENYLKDIEIFPRAVNEFLPNINYRIENTDQESKVLSDLRPQANNKSEKRSTSGSLNIEQNLFSGGKSMANMRYAQSTVKATKYRFYEDEQQNMLKASEAFAKFVTAKAIFEISSISVTNNAKQVEAATERLKFGEGTITEVASAKAAYASAIADQMQANAEYIGFKENFIKVFGITPENLTMPLRLENLPTNSEEFYEKVSKNNYNLHAIKFNLDAKKSQVVVATSEILPEVKATISKGYNKYLPESYSSRNVNNLNNRSFTTTVSVNIPILPGGGAAYSKIRSSKNDVRIAAYASSDVTKQVKAQAVQVWETMQSYIQALKSSEEAVEAAALSYEGIMQEQAIGLKSILDVIKIEEQLTQAKIRKIKMESTLFLNMCQVKALMGQFTAKALKLKVKYFDPENELKHAKFKVVGL